MFPIATLLSVLHLVLLSAFVGVASLSMLLTLISHMRVRCTLMVWRSGRLGGVPLGPSLFTLAVMGGLGYALATGQGVRPSMLIGYPAGGAFWIVAAYLARSIVITEYGIIHDVNRISQAVAWSQIVDYFVTDTKRGARYVFFYTDETHRRRCRLEVEVPAAQQEAFGELVAAKLRTRFAFEPAHLPDPETFEE